MSSENTDGPARTPSPPRGLDARGRRVWRQIQRDFVLDPHKAPLLHELCRTYDTLDELHAAAVRDGTVVTNGSGGSKVHPAVVEARQLRLVIARLTSALGLPDDDGEGD